MTENKNDSINSILQHSCVVDKNCCVIFPTLGFPYLTLCPRQCKWKVATTYSAIIKIFEYENLLLLKLPQITRNNIKHCNQCEKKKNNNFIIFIRSFPDKVN